MTRALLALLALLLTSGNVRAQECLHGSNETVAERARREQAIQMARRINAQQAAAIAGSLTSRYRRASELDLSGMPDNFQFMLVVNGRQTYTFSLKDHSDPCYFAVFSDQDGFVYAAHPEPEMGLRLQANVSNSSR